MFRGLAALLGAAALALLPLAAHAHDFDLDKKQRVALAAFLREVFAEGYSADRLEPRALERLSRMLSPFKMRELSHIGHAHAVSRVSAIKKREVESTVRRVRRYRALSKAIAEPAQAALLVESSRGGDIAELQILLSKEPFGPSLVHALTSLQSHANPLVRHVVGRVAGLQRAFDFAETHRGWIVSLGRSLVTDREPAVAAAAAFDVVGYRSRELIDFLFDRANDQRVRPERNRGLLSGGEQTVGASIQAALDGHFRVQAYPNVSAPKTAELAVMKHWWKGVRSDWTFSPSRSLWDAVFVGQLTVQQGGVTRIEAEVWGQLWIDVRRFKVFLHNGEPSYRLHLRVCEDAKAERQLVAIDMPAAYLGLPCASQANLAEKASPRGSTPATAAHYLRVMPAPTRESGRVRLFVELWSSK